MDREKFICLLEACTPTEVSCSGQEMVDVHFQEFLRNINLKVNKKFYTIKDLSYLLRTINHPGSFFVSFFKRIGIICLEKENSLILYRISQAIWEQSVKSYFFKKVICPQLNCRSKDTKITYHMNDYIFTCLACTFTKPISPVG